MGFFIAVCIFRTGSEAVKSLSHFGKDHMNIFFSRNPPFFNVYKVKRSLLRKEGRHAPFGRSVYIGLKLHGGLARHAFSFYSGFNRWHTGGEQLPDMLM